MPYLRTRPRADGTVSYAVLFRVDGKQTSETFDAKPGAQAFMRDIERHGPATARRILDARREQQVTDRTVVDQLRAHIDALSSITLGTRRRYAYIANTVEVHHVGSLPLTVVSTSDMAAWVRDLYDSGLSGKTISVRRQLLSAAFKRAIGDGLMTRNPLDGVKVPRSERREQTYLTEAEFLRILAAVDDYWQPLVLTLVTTGLRIGEASALQVRDLHLEDYPPTLSVHRGWVYTQGPERVTGAPKTDRGRRTIALAAETVAALEIVTAGKKPTDWVFTHPDGEPVRRERLANYWGRWVKRADVGKSPRLHDLRHTHASWMLSRMSLTSLQHRLGHSSIKVTSDVYGHLLPEDQVQAARAARIDLGQAFSQGRAEIGQH